MSNQISSISKIERTPIKLKSPKPPAQLSFSQSWLDKRNLKAENLKLHQINNDFLEPEILKGDFLMVDSANTSIVNGKYHAFIYDSEFYIKRLEILPNGDLNAIDNNGIQLIKQSNSILFINMGVVVHRQGEL